MLAVKKTVVVAISTIGKSTDTKHGGFRQILAKPDDFCEIRITLICDECLAKGVRNPCPHKKWNKPHWFSDDDKTVFNLYSDSKEDQDTKNREMYGISSLDQDTGRCFKSSDILKLVTEPRKVFDKSVRYVSVSVDPFTGSNDVKRATSDYALVTCVNGTIILGMEAISSNEPKEIEDIIIRHLKKIREMEYFQTCIFLLDVESGTGLEAPRIDDAVRSSTGKDIISIWDFENKKGTFTSNVAKSLMLENILNKLKRDELQIARDFFSILEPPESVLAKLSSQMERTRTQYIPSKSMTAPVKFTVDGKGVNGKEKDDLIITLMRSLYVFVKFYTKKYQKYHY